jgi:hypothetical protein
LAVANYPPVSVSDSSNQTSFEWTYYENGVDVHSKKLQIGLMGEEVNFCDTWNLFTVGTFGVLSEEEAKSIGWAAAQSYNITRVAENGTATVLHLGWANARTEITLGMIPRQMGNDSTPGISNYRSMGNATRDPMKLYPLWQMIFYFNESVGDSVGIQVGVWGDTKEISYCLEYGFLGSPSPSSTPTASPSPPSTSSPTNQSFSSTSASPPAQTESSTSLADENLNPTPNGNDSLLQGVALEAVAAAVVVAVTGVFLVKRRGRKRMG